MWRLARLLGGCLFASVVGAVGLASHAGAQLAHGPASVEVIGTELAVTLPDGRVLRSPDLVGATLTVGAGVRLRIEAVEDQRDRLGRPIWLHTFSTPAPDGRWQNICRVGPDGRQAGFPVPGRATGEGTLAEAGPAVFEITCTGGAQAKCVRFGYLPLGTAPDGRSMRDVYNTCVRMVRADYGGTGEGFTSDGTAIDLYDDWGIQTADLADGHDFEAGWGPEGAVCVRHVRVKENASLPELEHRFPRLRGRTGAVCTEEFARANGARLFNRSRP